MTAAQELPAIGALGEWAVHYAEHGLEIFPCKANKQPVVSQYDATTDPAQIILWWQQYPTALIGHRIAEGQVLVDIDPKNGGGATWLALKAEHGDTPTTRSHLSGRGDKGGHQWYQRPAGRLSTRPLDMWAKEHGTGQELGARWSSGIDLLQRDHRYTILPPSPHPETQKPYSWRNGLEVPPAAMPLWLAALITLPDPPPAPPAPAGGLLDSLSDESPADWYSRTHRLSDILHAHGWTVVHGNGDEDASLWRHPTATHEHSASVKHGCLFVHSTGTPLEPTAPGDPHGYTPFRLYTVLDHAGDGSRAARHALEERDGVREHIDPGSLVAPQAERQAAAGVHGEASLPDGFFLDWEEFWTKDRTDVQWLAEPILAKGRGHVFYAGHKTGKSLLVLSYVAQLATGPDPIVVIYLDYEMSEDDIYERLADMGYGPEADLARLRYALLPALRPLDTKQGAADIFAIVDAVQTDRPDHHIVLVIDTTSRAVAGEENEADTFQDYYRETGMHLKKRGLTTIRLDHAGKDPEKGQRGSSAKGDDVDVVWLVERADDGYILKRRAARMSWIPERVAVTRQEFPLRFVPVSQGWPAGTSDLAHTLEAVGVPIETGYHKAGKTLRDAGHKYSNDAIRVAQKWRRQAGRPTVEDLI